MHFIGVFNRDGGTFKTTDMETFCARAVTTFAAHGHTLEPRVVEGHDVFLQLERAGREADALLAGGGDGTISAAAAIAFHRGIPLAVLPAGTMNLFARSLKVPLSLDAALDALAQGTLGHVDIATANGRPFVHQFSVGVHAKLVKLRETLTYRSRLGKMVASARAFAGALLKPPNFRADLQLPQGVESRRTSGISVSNNPYGEGHLPHADSLNAGVLGIYVSKPLSSWALLKLCFWVAVGRWKNVPEVIEREAREVTIRFPRKKSTALAVVDGELISLAERIDLKLHPGALKVVMPQLAKPDTPASAVLSEA